MKKVLFTTTALVFAAGASYAEVGLTGGAMAGFAYDENGSPEVQFKTMIDFNIVGTGSSDSGIEFGASVDVDADDINGITNNQVTDPEVFVSGAFGKITFGNVSVANDGIGFSDVGWDGIGVDDDAEAGKNQGEANFSYTNTFGGFSVVLTGDTYANDMGIAVGYAADTYSFGVGYTKDESTNIHAVAAEAGASFGDFGLNVFYKDVSDGRTGYGVDASYTVGATTVTVAYGHDDMTDADYGIGVSHDLGGGLSVAGGVGMVNDRTKADFGLTMSF